MPSPTRNPTRNVLALPLAIGAFPVGFIIILPGGEDGPDGTDDGRPATAEAAQGVR